MPSLREAIGRTCLRAEQCSRTGKPHENWRPKVVRGRVVSFATSEEREYPSGFCEAYASSIQTLAAESGFSFIDVFSGPNAPLSNAVASLTGEVVEKVSSESAPQGADQVELSRLPPTLRGETSCTTHERALSEAPIKAESDAYRSAAVGAAKQPSYGKRTQLLPDGLKDPELHLAKAKKLSHPFDDEHSLKKDHRDSIDALVSQGETLVQRRLELLEQLRRRRDSLQEQQSRENRRASWTARRLGLKIQTALMRELQERYSIEDRKVPDLCLSGIGIIGPADESP